MSMRKATRGTILALAACLLLGGPARATTLVALNLPDMVDRADRIFVGWVTSTWTGRDDEGLPATRTTFHVDRVLKGSIPTEMTIKQLGVTRAQPDGLATWVDGMPKFLLGYEYLVFLGPDSELGFTSPVGLLQGSFVVFPGPEGEKWAINGINNANLLQGLSSEELTQLGFSPDNFPFTLTGNGRLQLDELLGMVERIRETGKRTTK